MTAHLRVCFKLQAAGTSLELGAWSLEPGVMFTHGTAAS